LPAKPIAMADAEHSSVRRRRSLLPTEGETDETDETDETGAAEINATQNPRPKPLNNDATTYPQTRILCYWYWDDPLGSVLNSWMTTALTDRSCGAVIQPFRFFRKKMWT
jgi:hypothetical protein